MKAVLLAHERSIRFGWVDDDQDMLATSVHLRNARTLIRYRTAHKGRGGLGALVRGGPTPDDALEDPADCFCSGVYVMWPIEPDVALKWEHHVNA